MQGQSTIRLVKSASRFFFYDKALEEDDDFAKLKRGLVIDEGAERSKVVSQVLILNHHCMRKWPVGPNRRSTAPEGPRLPGSGSFQYFLRPSAPRRV